MTESFAIQARGLSKSYGSFTALKGIALNVPEGSICGLVGPNGAGKSTALKSLVGLCDAQGEISVLGQDPRRNRASLMIDACFVADVGVLPRNLRASEILSYVADVHPRFDRDRAKTLLRTARIDPRKRVKELSKGMVTQLHLAMILAIDVKLLILDEPTLGLDILNRKEFYNALLTYAREGKRTLIISTHQIEEVESLLSHLIFLKQGEVVLEASLEEINSRFTEVAVTGQAVPESLKPIARWHSQAAVHYLFDANSEHPLDGATLASLGEVSKPRVADLFVSLMSRDERTVDGAISGGDS